MNDSITFVYIYTCLCIAKLLLLFFGHLFGILLLYTNPLGVDLFSLSLLHTSFDNGKSFVWFVEFLFGNSRFGFLLFFFSSFLLLFFFILFLPIDFVGFWIDLVFMMDMIVYR